MPERNRQGWPKLESGEDFPEEKWLTPIEYNTYGEYERRRLINMPPPSLYNIAELNEVDPPAARDIVRRLIKKGYLNDWREFGERSRYTTMKIDYKTVHITDRKKN